MEWDKENYAVNARRTDRHESANNYVEVAHICTQQFFASMKQNWNRFSVCEINFRNCGVRVILHQL